VLNLTADLIGFNSADYTAWEVRWQCLQQPGVDMQQEYAFTEGIMEVGGQPCALCSSQARGSVPTNRIHLVAVRAAPCLIDIL
jgi:hypothetical protein